MNEISKTGVFLCKCGKKIEPLVDLPALEKKLTAESNIIYCETLPYPCLTPGLNHIISKIRENNLNRLVIAGCEGRLMLKKFEKALISEGFNKGQIDVVNLRDHVANVSDITPEEKSDKGAKLIKAAVAEMEVFTPCDQETVNMDAPPVIVGGGIASFSAAKELSRQGIDSLLSLEETDTDSILNNVCKFFPGERPNYSRLEKLIKEVKNSSHVTIIPKSKLSKVSGITGIYSLSFTVDNEPDIQKYEASTIITCIDRELSAPEKKFGYDGATVLCQTDFEDIVWNKLIPKGNTVFWINDYESDQGKFAQLSARSAWVTGKHMMEKSQDSKVVILYNEQMPLPLSAQERALSRKLGLSLISYDKSIKPVLQTDYINFGTVNDRLEHELPWDRIILSPVHKTDKKTIETGRILGLVYAENDFLNTDHVRVRPEMIGHKETYFAGSAFYPCNLETALSQGRKAGRKNGELVKKAQGGKLFPPRFVSFIDPDKCVSCGQCQALCDCNAISIADGDGAISPRIVDPMLCTGGGTCAAACPYQAITIKNNTNEQRETRAASLSNQMADDEFVTFACSWSALPAADNAGVRNLKYDHKGHIIGVPCVGLIDASVMAKAFVEGAPGVLIVGCVPEDCHHSFGVDHAWSRINLMKKLFSLCGFERQRIAFAHSDLNRPEEFANTMGSFSKTVASLGPIENTPENKAKLKSIYRLVKYNSRIRLLLSAGLRRPWETTYKGDQEYTLAYDREDFTEALKEELIKARLEEIFVTEKRSFNIKELKETLSEDSLIEQLDELDLEGVITHSYKEGIPFYTLCN